MAGRRHINEKIERNFKVALLDMVIHLDWYFDDKAHYETAYMKKIGIKAALNDLIKKDIDLVVKEKIDKVEDSNNEK